MGGENGGANGGEIGGGATWGPDGGCAGNGGGQIIWRMHKFSTTQLGASIGTHDGRCCGMYHACDRAVAFMPGRLLSLEVV